MEFASKIVKVGTGARRKRIKLQLWDTAGTERFRSVSRSYYRGAAGAVLIYDLSSHSTFQALSTFLDDARALASPNLTLLLAGNKVDVTTSSASQPSDTGPSTSSSSNPASNDHDTSDPGHPSTLYGLGAPKTVTLAPEGREVTQRDAALWASQSDIPVTVEISAFTGEGVEEVFTRLASMILTKIELGEINPDDPTSGIQYGDGGTWDDGGSVKSRGTLMDEAGGSARRRKRGRYGGGTLNSGLRDWEQVFKLDSGRRRRGGCC